MIDLALGHRRRKPQRPAIGRWPALIAIAGAVVLTGAPIAYMVWPQPAPVAVDAPALPITVGGVTFNVPPAAIRLAMQRQAGTQTRLDLAFVWPTLDPPAPADNASAAAAAHPIERLFVTIAVSDGTLSPVERLKVIYPRYTAQPETVDRDGLVVRAFRIGSPYQGEDLIYDPAAAERFLLRCSRTVSSTPGICLHERRIAGADVTVRFPRNWLGDWRNVSTKIERLLARLRPAGR